MHHRLKHALKSRNLLKVISGINNFSFDKVRDIAIAADISRATYIDIAASEKLVKEVKQYTNLPICISSLDPELIYSCVINGADLLEIGNYDLFYKHGIFFSVDRIISITKQVQKLLPKITVCVTIPHTLLIQEQIYLAQQLVEELGVDMLQTEGFSSHSNKINIENVSEIMNQVSATLSSTYALKNSVEVPIITSSGISHTTALMAIKNGAAGVGVGNCISKLNSISEMATMIKIVKKSLQRDSKIDYYSGKSTFSKVYSKYFSDKI